MPAEIDRAVPVAEELLWKQTQLLPGGIDCIFAQNSHFDETHWQQQAIHRLSTAGDSWVGSTEPRKLSSEPCHSHVWVYFIYIFRYQNCVVEYWLQCNVLKAARQSERLSTHSNIVTMPRKAEK